MFLVLDLPKSRLYSPTCTGQNFLTGVKPFIYVLSPPEVRQLGEESLRKSPLRLYGGTLWLP